MKKLALLFVVAFIVGLVAAPAMAAGKSDKKKKKVGHLYLYEKVPSDVCCDPWDIVTDGAWGKMKYNKSGKTSDFVFNGHGLPADQNYELIYYPDKLGEQWPREDVQCLGDGGTTNGGGNIHIQGSENTGDLPNVDVGDIDGLDWPAIDGAKIWLVLADDVNCDGEVFNNVWNPEDYLFEGEGIEFEDTDG